MLNIDSVSKSFGDVAAVSSVSMEAQSGEILGLLGPNGAGKTTIINMVSCVVPPDQGNITINGHHHSQHKSQYKLSFGCVPQEIALYDDMTALENLLFWGGLYQLDKEKLKSSATRALSMVGLQDRQHDRIKTFSGGMKRRINIASAVLHEPKLLLMDEPTVGVDAQSRHHIFEMIEAFRDQGMCILYTSHYMEEVERLCDRIAIMDNGKVLTVGTKEELIQGIATKLELKLHLEMPLPEVDRTTLPGDLDQRGSLRVEIESIEEVGGIIASVKAKGVQVCDIETNRPDLESVFLELTGKALRD